MSRFPFPIPHGWFGLCFSDELASGEVKKIRFCGRDLAVFRTESGQPAALYNYCRHLGAPLHQGCVVGENLRCPFHHWQWSGDGACKDIPYAKRIPERARQDSVAVREMNGLILGWHHAGGSEPYFEPEIWGPLEGESEGWGPVQRFTLDIPTCLQEIAENDVDQAHFPYLHEMDGMAETNAELDGPFKTSMSEMIWNNDFIVGDATKVEPFRLHRRSVGPGMVYLHGTGMLGTKGQVGEYFLLSIASPVDDEQTRLLWQMAVSESLDGDGVGDSILHGFSVGVGADMPIWAEKEYQPDPVLCDGDGPIAKFRKWFSQFYDHSAAA